MFNLSGKKALVTGATQGIGLAVAELLASHGAVVYVNGASSMEKCQKACEKIPNAVPVQADLTNPSDIDALYRKTGDVDILVLNASVQYKRPWDSFTDTEYDVQLDCNLKSSYRLVCKYAPYMKAQNWGRIIMMGSVNQYNNHPELLVYGVTKAAQKKMSDSLAKQLAPYGITVNNIAPGAIKTPRNTEALRDEAYNQKVINSIPAGYVGSPADVSPMVLLLCSEEGRYITGADILIDGGMHL